MFEIDPGKLAEEARFRRHFVPRTNVKVTPLQAVLHDRVVQAATHEAGNEPERHAEQE